MPWYRAEFDLEGLGFGGLALVLAIILGGLHWILAFVFFLVFAVIMLAARDTERTSPTADDLVLSPCDGVIESVGPVSPPRELRWDTQEVVRVRISSSPFSVNGIRSSITGNVDSFLVEPGAPSALSTDPDNSDLREAFVLIGGEKHAVGLRVATGGLGPRLDIDLEAGDGVRAGRKIGVRRLGGWCDVFLPAAAATTLEPGMSVVGGETVLSDLTDLAPSYDRSTMVVEEIVPEPEPAPEPVAAAPVAPVATPDPVETTPETIPEEVQEEVSEQPVAEDKPAEAEPDTPTKPASKPKS